MCVLCRDVPLASHINHFCWVYFSFISLPFQRTAEQNTAQQGRAAHSKASRQARRTSNSHSAATHTGRQHTHIAQRGTAQPCSIVHSREVPQPQSTPEHKSIPVVQQHTAEHAQPPAACTQRAAQHNCNNITAVTEHAVHNSELIQIDKPFITTSGRAELST